MRHLICKLSEIPEGETRGFSVSALEGFVVHKNAQILAYRNACPHIGMNLEFAPDKFLDPEGKFIQCSMHGALFNIGNGECIHGPCLGDHLEALTIEITEGEVFLLT